MATSIYDIAQEAGVSAAAVSLALNNQKGVSEATRLRIKQIAEEMNYQKRPLKSDSQERMFNVILFISAMQYDYFNSSFYFDIIKHLSRVTAHLPFNLIIRLNTLAQDAEAIRNLAEKQNIDAYIFMGTRLSPRFIRQLVGESVPIIFFNKPQADGKNVFSVSFDNRRAMYLLAKHAIDLGHKDIVYLGYVPGAIPAENRLQGYKDAMEDAGIEIQNNHIVEAEYLPEFGESYIRKLISLGDPLPSAILCGNDRIAVGVMKALREHHFSIPDDISVAGIDNVPLSDMLSVPLTTIDVHPKEIGTALGDMLQAIHRRKVTQRHVVIDVTLIKRESTGPFNRNRKAKLNKITY